MSRLRHRLTGSAAAAAAVLALAVPAASAATPAQQHRTMSAAAGTAIDYFNTDSCHGSSFCMTVGASVVGNTSAPLAERLGASGWVVTPMPSPVHGANVFDNEVSCASPASCLLVGQHWAGQSGPSAILADYWNGSSWRIVVAPAPVPKGVSGLGDVACPTTRFCLAVGQSGLSGRFQDSAYTFTNGNTWRRISVPRPRGARTSELGGVSCADAHNCMAVGLYKNGSGHNTPFAARWHSGRWHLLATPSIPGPRTTWFEGISCPASTECVAVGGTLDSRGFSGNAFAEVWSGGKWRISAVRRQSSGFIGVSCPARNRCYASGFTFPTNTAHSLIETWNGRSWTTQQVVQTAAPLSGGDLQHVSCVNRSDCEAVGNRFNPKSNAEATLAEKWNGHRWVVQTTVNP